MKKKLTGMFLVLIMMMGFSAVVHAEIIGVPGPGMPRAIIEYCDFE